MPAVAAPTAGWAPPDNAAMHLLYLHGFRSSPASFKARRMADWLASHRPDVRWWCPQLPPSPAAAWALINQGIADWPRDNLAVVGSSLGGFYATAVAESTGCPAVLLNPAVEPARDLGRRGGLAGQAAQLGRQRQRPRLDPLGGLDILAGEGQAEACQEQAEPHRHRPRPKPRRQAERWRVAR